MRDAIFLSHANPEDNEFTTWIALQLRKEGYKVWCDLANLLGGETSWRDIELAIRSNVIKFAYVVSRESNQKEGCFKELQVASNTQKKERLNDFIIPLRIDDLPFEQFNILLSGIHAIDFYRNWPAGLKTLLEKLQKEKVFKEDTELSRSYVMSWWKTNFSTEMGVQVESDEYLSNWFEIKIPEIIYFHKVRYGVFLPQQFTYPVVEHSGYMISFAESKDLVVSGKSYAEGGRSFALSTKDFMDGENLPGFMSEEDARKKLVQLLRMSWEKLMKDNGFHSYEMSNQQKAFYGTEELLGAKMLSFNLRGVRKRKSLIGYKTIKGVQGVTKKRFWHFSISAKPILWPLCAYRIKSHVLFSDDMYNIWTNPNKMHKSRRSQCKNWWNDDWCDRMLLMISQLKGEKEKINIEVGSNVRLEVSDFPITFVSPVSYKEPEGRHIPAFVHEFKDETDLIDKVDEENGE